MQRRWPPQLTATFLALFFAIVQLPAVSNGEPAGYEQPKGPPAAFDYILKSYCPEGTDVLFWVHTRPSSYEKRQQIRTSWGNGQHLRKALQYNSSLRFFVGLTDDADANGALLFESDKYDDIVQEAYVDSYYNLTYKAMSGVRWIVESCNVSRLVSVVKVDDDTAISAVRLLKRVNRTGPLKRLRNTIHCPVAKKAEVKRGGGSKWSVPTSQYPGKFYPSYCQGLIVVLTPDVLPAMLKQAKTTAFFWIDDVYLTGLLTKPLETRMVSIYREFSEWPQHDRALPVCASVAQAWIYSERIYRHYWHMVQPDPSWEGGEHPACLKNVKG